MNHEHMDHDHEHINHDQMSHEHMNHEHMNHEHRDREHMNNHEHMDHDEHSMMNEVEADELEPVTERIKIIRKPPKPKRKGKNGKGKGKKGNRNRNGRRFGRNNLNSVVPPFNFRIPKTNFTCKGRAPGYYADMEAHCKVYHMCNSRGGGRGFLCPQGTKFAQRTMVCDFEKKVKCNDASDFFHRNLIIHEASLVGNWATSRNNRIKEQKPRKQLRKLPRLTEADIITIKRPEIVRAKSNGRMGFAPLFEEQRRQKMDMLNQVVKIMKSNNNPTRQKNQQSIRNSNPKPLTITTTSLFPRPPTKSVTDQRIETARKRKQPTLATRRTTTTKTTTTTKITTTISTKTTTTKTKTTTMTTTTT